MVVATSGRDDWILCQVTSNPYADPRAIELTDGDFLEGSLQRTSYARPGKLFTANASLMTRSPGRLTNSVFYQITSAIITLIKSAAESV